MDIWGVLEYTVAVTVVGLLIGFIKLIFHDKLDARWHYFIWLVLLLRMVVPVHFRLISTPLSIFQELPLEKWIEMGRILAEKKGLADLLDLLGKIYLWGVAIFGSLYLSTWVLLRVQVAFSPKADQAVKEYVDGIAVKYGLKSCKDIRIRKSSTPYICGVFCPVLILPAGEELPEESVIVHELLHKKWKDVLINIAVHVARVINWFNPVIWVLTAVVLNDSEALCDQRVLEVCGEENAHAYGELLIAMGEKGRQEPFGKSARTGTSNMASSYRNMRIRIRRIRDFRRMPEKLGLVTFCITLMLALSGIGSAAKEQYSFKVPQIEAEKDLEKALLYARCYHAHTPEEAVYLFLRACEEHSNIYRMAVMPEAEIPQYEEFVREWFLKTGMVTFTELEEKGYPVYFPHETDRIVDYRIYNLLCDEITGSATVCATPNGKQGEAFTVWELTLVNENGWKVWLDGESGQFAGAYKPEPLLSGDAYLGDFLIEVHGYNEGYYKQLGATKSLFSDPEEFPVYFSTEYKYSELFATYLGEESLEGLCVQVACREVGEDSGSEKNVLFNGKDLMDGEPHMVYGEGDGYVQPGWCWKADDRMGMQVQIKIDGKKIEEGEVWSEKP